MSKISLTPVAILALSLLPLAGAQSYLLTDLTPLPNGGTSFAAALNDQGMAAGSSNLSDGNLHAVIWTNTGIHDIGTLAGSSVASAATGINNSGQVSGSSELANKSIWHAFSYTGSGGMQDLGTLGGQNSSASGINDAGQIVGTADLSDGVTTHAFLWSAATGMQDLGSLGGNSYAAGINHAGAVVGYYLVSGTTYHAFLWTQSAGMQDLGSLGGGGSFAYAINSSGQIAGIAYSSQSLPYSLAGRWSASHVLQNIGAGVQSVAYGLNDSAEIVGSSSSFGAFVWTSTAHTQNLNDLIPPGTGFMLYQAFAVNRSGQIVTTGTSNNGGDTHGALLTPVN